METQINEVQTEKASGGRKTGLTAGIILVAIGLLLLAGQLIDLGGLIFVIPGVVMLAAGAVRRSQGLIIPGGILSGIGAGAMIVEGHLVVMPGADEGALFLIPFALGFALITVFSALFTERALLWPLIPAGVMALISAAVLAGGPALEALKFVVEWWPVVLILIGAAVLAGTLVRRQQ